jgi:hypothetical protein
MNYYCISETSYDPQGVVPQIDGYDDDYDSGPLDAVLAELRARPVPIREMEIKLKLDVRADVTDILTCVVLTPGLLISQKLADILREHKLPSHQLLPTSVNTHGRHAQYYWLRFTEDITATTLDFTRTVFMEYNPWTQERKTMLFKSDEERNTHYKTLHPLTTITTDNLYFLPHDYDLLKPRGLFTGFIVSQKLLDVMKKNGITGYFERNNVRVSSTTAVGADLSYLFAY